ncbi:MAG: VWA domain-containing protein [Planctomycetaceae bacterium]|jgi:hypothetical protein|nr:VWA domain-containing protein [Planctomycetaceae bacterium]
MDSVLISLSRRAWIGSLLFHLLLLLILIFLLRFQPAHEPLVTSRNANGKILVKQVNGNTTQYSGVDGVKFTDKNPFESEDEIVQGLFTDITPLQPPQRIGVGLNVDVNSDVLLFGANHANDPAMSVNNVNGNSNGISGGGKKLLHVFGTAAEGNNFVFVFDKSGSMNERGGISFRAAKAELLRNIQELNNEKCKFNIIFYNDGLNQWNDKGMLEATELNCRQAIIFVQSEVARGGTKHFEPLVAAIRQKPDAIFFLTDGDDNDAMTQMQLNEIKRINQINKVRINIIQFGVGKYRTSEFLKQLAKDNNGLYSYINVTELSQ